MAYEGAFRKLIKVDPKAVGTSRGIFHGPMKGEELPFEFRGEEAFSYQ